MDSWEPEATEKMSNSWRPCLLLAVLVEKDKLPCAVPASISTSWDSYDDMPGTRDCWSWKCELLSSLTIRACAKFRRSRGVFFGASLSCWDAVHLLESLSCMLDQLELEKSTSACPKRPRRTRFAVHFACWVTRTSSKCKVALLFRFLQRRKIRDLHHKAPPC